MGRQASGIRLFEIGGLRLRHTGCFMCEVLVVDLDGTLLRSDMLFESFWSAFSLDWKSPFRAAQALSKGKAFLKRHLANAADVDVETLPYDEDVIAYIRAWREQGRSTALVTASDNAIAQKIGAHLGLFDEVYGSNGTDNLKGARKATFLVEKYGDKAFAYMGDSEADLEVWARAKKAITVNLSDSLQMRAGQAAPEVEHLKTHSHEVRSYLKAIRPHQWMKNGLVFLPILASHQIDGASFLNALLAFISFSLVASSVYVLNDLLDLKADRAHPRKRLRPFAAGAIPIGAGT